MKKALMISCFNWYKTRLEPIREIFLKKDYDVTVLIADFDHIRKMSVQTRYEECTYIHVLPYKSNLSVQRIRSHLKFGNAVKGYLERLKPDLVYIQVPPNNVAKYCTAYRERNKNTKLIVDIIDLWPESMLLERMKKTPPANIWKQWRDDCVKAADHVFTECEMYQKKLSYVVDMSKTSTLYLFKQQNEEEKILVERILKEKSVEKDDGKKKIKFAYLGSMNSIIDIDGICEIIGICIQKGFETELHAIGDGESRDRFEKSARKTGCEAHFYGQIFDEKEKIKLLAPCDYAFNMMKGTTEVGLTIKSVDYLSMGLPLVNNIKGDTWELIDKEKIGCNIENSDEFSIDNMFAINCNVVRQSFIKLFEKEAFLVQVNRMLQI